MMMDGALSAVGSNSGTGPVSWRSIRGFESGGCSRKMEAGVALLPCRSLGLICHHRQRTSSGLSASCSFHSSPSLGVSRHDFLDVFVGRVSALCSFEGRFHGSWQALELDSESGGCWRRGSRGAKCLPTRAGALPVGVQDCEEWLELETTASAVQLEGVWDQCRRLVQTEEMSEDEASWVARRVMGRTGHAGFAAISARTHRPPPLPPPRRSKVPRYVTASVFFSVTALVIWQVNRTESYAREQLLSRDQPAATSPPSQMDSAFERAKASVAQTACVNRAVAAVRNNNFMECTIEMELALEENRLARTSIESDFYEEEEILQVYQGVIKMWLDGYPLDYGKVLQLRILLDLPSPKAEALEQEVLQQSDAYVI